MHNNDTYLTCIGTMHWVYTGMSYLTRKATGSHHDLTVEHTNACDPSTQDSWATYWYYIKFSIENQEIFSNY
jgi:hypothetical protein